MKCAQLVNSVNVLQENDDWKTKRLYGISDEDNDYLFLNGCVRFDGLVCVLNVLAKFIIKSEKVKQHSLEKLGNY